MLALTTVGREGARCAACPPSTMTTTISSSFPGNGQPAPSSGRWPDAEKPLPLWWWLAGAVFVAILLALLLTAQSYISAVAEGDSFDWSRQLRRQLFFWITRAALVPLVVALGARARVDKANWLRTLPLWLVGMVLFGALQATLLLLFDFNLPWLSQPPPPPDPMPPFWFAVWVRLNVTAVANVMSFIIIAVAYHAVEYYRAWRTRETAHRPSPGRRGSADSQHDAHDVRDGVGNEDRHRGTAGMSTPAAGALP